VSLQAAVTWTAFTTLLATLDADEAGQTNSRLLLLLPYGIAPAAALGFFAQPLAACLCEQRRRWTKAKERRAAAQAVGVSCVENPLKGADEPDCESAEDCAEKEKNRPSRY